MNLNFLNTKFVEDFKEVVSDSDEFLHKKEKIEIKKRSKSTGEISKRTHKTKRKNSNKTSSKSLKLSANETVHEKYNFVTCKELAQHIRDPLLLIIDVRPFGLLSATAGETYNAKHIRLSINIPMDGKSDEQIMTEIESDQFLSPMLSFSIQTQYKIVIYDQYCLGESSPSFQFYSILQSFAMKFIPENSIIFDNIFLLSGGFAEFENFHNNLCGNTKNLRSPLENSASLEENVIDQIHPRIFLGRQLSLDEVELLRKNNIQHVLSISNTQDQLPDDIKLLFIQLEDTQASDLLEVLDEACNFIEEALNYNNNTGNIFIHCSRGLSRSPTVLIAYLMKKLNLSTKESFELVKKSRPNIGPQCNFIRQLLLLEKELSGGTEDFVPSLPLQIYVLHETRCEDYYRNLEFLFVEKKKEKFDFYTSTVNFLKRKLLVDR